MQHLWAARVCPGHPPLVDLASSAGAMGAPRRLMRSPPDALAGGRAAGTGGRGASAMSLAELEARQDPTAELTRLIRASPPMCALMRPVAAQPFTMGCSLADSSARRGGTDAR